MKTLAFLGPVVCSPVHNRTFREGRTDERTNERTNERTDVLPARIAPFQFSENGVKFKVLWTFCTSFCTLNIIVSLMLLVNDKQTS